MQWIKTSEDFFKKIYLSLYCKVCVWEGVGDWTKTAIYWPPLLWPSALCLSRSPDAQPEAWGLSFLLAFSTTSYHQLVWSPNSIGGPEGPFCWVVAFLTISCLQLVWSPTQLGAFRAPSAGRWLSLPQLVSDFSGPQLLTSCLHRVI